MEVNAYITIRCRDPYFSCFQLGSCWNGWHSYWNKCPEQSTPGFPIREICKEGIINVVLTNRADQVFWPTDQLWGLDSSPCRSKHEIATPKKWYSTERDKSANTLAHSGITTWSRHRRSEGLVCQALNETYPVSQACEMFPVCSDESEKAHPVIALLGPIGRGDSEGSLDGRWWQLCDYGYLDSDTDEEEATLILSSELASAQVIIWSAPPNEERYRQVGNRRSGQVPYACKRHEAKQGSFN